MLSENTLAITAPSWAQDDHSGARGNNCQDTDGEAEAGAVWTAKLGTKKIESSKNIMKSRYHLGCNWNQNQQ